MLYQLSYASALVAAIWNGRESCEGPVRRPHCAIHLKQNSTGVRGKSGAEGAAVLREMFVTQSVKSTWA